jgi:hypothetical protein
MDNEADCFQRRRRLERCGAPVSFGFEGLA